MEKQQESAFDSKEACNAFAGFLSAELKREGKKFEFTEPNKLVIKKLVHYFSGDPNLEENTGMSRRKGIFLYGPVGTGKTTLMKAVRNLSLKTIPFRIVNCRDIQWQFAKTGAETLELYGRRSFMYDYFKGYLRDKPIHYCFDDFGAENRAKHFGNDTNVMEEILQDRYSELEHGMLTHVTSNLGKNWDDIEKIYGTRIRSRSREMFNHIELDDKDHRA